MFKPSQRLVDLVRANSIVTDANEFEGDRRTLLSESDSLALAAEPNNTEEFASAIAMAIEDVLARIVMYCPDSVSEFQLTENSQFTKVVVNELIDDLKLDLYKNPGVVLNALYEDLASTNEITFGFGVLRTNDIGDIILSINRKAIAEANIKNKIEIEKIFINEDNEDKVKVF